MCCWGTQKEKKSFDWITQIFHQRFDLNLIVMIFRFLLLRNPTVEYSEPELLLQKAANDSDERYVIPTNQSRPFNQQQVSDLIRDLSLCKEHLNSWHIALKTEASYNKVLKWLSQNMRWGICAVYWWKTELIFFS